MMTDERRSETGTEMPQEELVHSAAEEGGEEEAPRPEAGGEGVDAQIEALRAEMDALNDRHLRLAAEFDNYRKRNERERAELWARAQAELAASLLESLDDLQRVSAVEVANTSVESLLEGVQLIEKKLRRSLEASGLEPIAAEGEFFNPETMEALMTVPTDKEEEDDMVADVFQAGYRFKDILIRPARVRVKKYE